MKPHLLLAHSGHNHVHAPDVGHPTLSESAWTLGTFALRLGEALVVALPDLLVGVLIAVLLRHVVGDDRLRRWFGKTWVVAAAVLALPVGAAGVLPVAVVLRRAGVGLSSVMAVLLVGGATGPLALAYLMERATPVSVGVLAVMLAGTASLIPVGGRKEPERIGDDEPGLASALAEARPLLWASVLPLLIGLIAYAAVASFLPPSFLGVAMFEPSALHLLAVVAVPPVGFYLPETAALLAGEAAAGQYPGAVWTMLLGCGLTLGSVVLAFRLAGLRIGGIAIGVVVGALLLGFFALQLAPRLVPLATEDSHAFDGLSRPFHIIDHRDGPVAGLLFAWGKLAGLGTATSALALLLLLIVPWRKFARPVSGRHLSTSVLRRLGVVGVIAWAAATLWIYYPAPSTVLEQMRHAEGELSSALGGRDLEQARTALTKLDRLAHRGRVGAILRIDTATADQLADVQQHADQMDDQVRQAPDTVTIIDATDLLNAIRALRR